MYPFGKSSRKNLASTGAMPYANRVKPWRLGAIALCLAFAVPAIAAADPQPTTFIAIEDSSYSSDQYLDREGQQQTSNCTFKQQSIDVYVSHQTTVRDTIFGDTSYSHDWCGDASTTGLGDIELGYQRGISGINHPNLFAIRASVIAPTGYDIGANPNLGLGRPGASLGAVYLGGFQGAPHHYGFITASAGMKAYTSYPAPQLLTNVSVGYGLTPGVQVIESYFGTTHLGAGGQLQNVGVNPFVSSIYNSYQLSSNVIFALGQKVGLHVGYWKLLGGFNVGTGSQLYAGFWLKF
jgi:hypothetical protein